MFLTLILFLGVIAAISAVFDLNAEQQIESYKALARRRVQDITE
ncbi:MAG: hypothetical protein WBC71_13630 [Salaquimonas sp.]